MNNRARIDAMSLFLVAGIVAGCGRYPVRRCVPALRSEQPVPQCSPLSRATGRSYRDSGRVQRVVGHSSMLGTAPDVCGEEFVLVARVIMCMIDPK